MRLSVVRCGGRRIVRVTPPVLAVRRERRIVLILWGIEVQFEYRGLEGLVEADDAVVEGEAPSDDVLDDGWEDDGGFTTVSGRLVVVGVEVAGVLGAGLGV